MLCSLSFERLSHVIEPSICPFSFLLFFLTLTSTCCGMSRSLPNPSQAGISRAPKQKSKHNDDDDVEREKFEMTLSAFMHKSKMKFLPAYVWLSSACCLDGYCNHPHWHTQLLQLPILTFQLHFTGALEGENIFNLRFRNTSGLLRNLQKNLLTF